ncbi:rhodanese-like domain-containing protein [Aureibaculum luteum]|uniref:rhodanese-like domain-containing protein n=1 Tax=Aureibaculum luteum TaxID=1548456 RepID=UPI000E52ED89|nr:rhodanese-like domain-containing protein [Aureibaculum luteum]
MKELEKTKRISIAAVFSILLVIIALLSYKKPKNLYTITTKTALEMLLDKNIAVNVDILNDTTIVPIDIRSQYDYEKGYIQNAIHMEAAEVLSNENIEILEKIKANNKMAVLYGNNPEGVIAPYAVLIQMGYNNLKILKVENSYHQNQLITKNVDLEKSIIDIPKFIKGSAKNANIKPKSNTHKAPKKVITIKKSKKNKPEGGC